MSSFLLDAFAQLGKYFEKMECMGHVSKLSNLKLIKAFNRVKLSERIRTILTAIHSCKKKAVPSAVG